MARKTDHEYFSPAPDVQDLAYQFPFDNEYEIFTLRKDMQPTAPAGNLHVWGNKKDNSNPGGTTGFYTTDTKFMAKLFDPLSIIETGCACMIEFNYTLDQNWPLAFGFTPIARKRQLSLIMQNHGISIIVDLYVPEKFADLNLVGVPDGYSAFATRGHSNDILALETRYTRARDTALRGKYCLDASSRISLQEEAGFPNPLLNILTPIYDVVYESRKEFFTAIFNLCQTLTPPIRQRDYDFLFWRCEKGRLNVFLVYGGGEKVRAWVMEKNETADRPHIWWYPDAMDTIRVNRTKEVIFPKSDEKGESIF